MVHYLIPRLLSNSKFHWLARKGAGKAVKASESVCSVDTRFGRVKREILASLPSPTLWPYSHSLQTIRSKTARIRMNNAKDTTVVV